MTILRPSCRGSQRIKQGPRRVPHGKTFFHTARETDRMTSLRDVHGGRFLFSRVLWGVATSRTWCAASRHNDVCLSDGNTWSNRIGTDVCVEPSVWPRMTNTIKPATPQESQRICWQARCVSISAIKNGKKLTIRLAKVLRTIGPCTKARQMEGSKGNHLQRSLCSFLHFADM